VWRDIKTKSFKNLIDSDSRFRQGLSKERFEIRGLSGGRDAAGIESADESDEEFCGRFVPGVVLLDNVFDHGYLSCLGLEIVGRIARIGSKSQKADGLPDFSAQSQRALCLCGLGGCKVPSPQIRRARSDCAENTRASTRRLRT